MPKYVTVKVRAEILEGLKRCQRPGETLSDTLLHLLNPLMVMEREAEARERDKAGAGKGG